MLCIKMFDDFYVSEIAVHKNAIVDCILTDDIDEALKSDDILQMLIIKYLLLSLDGESGAEVMEV